MFDDSNIRKSICFVEMLCNNYVRIEIAIDKNKSMEEI